MTRRGVSPRVISAEVVGTRGATAVDGATLQTRFGLYDTWAYFTTITAGKAPAAKHDHSGGVVAPRSFAYAAKRPPGALRGSVIGPRRGARLSVQALSDGRWTAVGSTRAGRHGAYRWTAKAPGTYRVVVQGAAGPAVRL